MHPNTGYKAVKRAIEPGLVISDFDDSSSFRKRAILLTAMGRRAVFNLKEINDIPSD